MTARGEVLLLASTASQSAPRYLCNDCRTEACEDLSGYTGGIILCLRVHRTSVSRTASRCYRIRYITAAANSEAWGGRTGGRCLLTLEARARIGCGRIALAAREVTFLRRESRDYQDQHIRAN
jgi:hypothetical protein